MKFLIAFTVASSAVAAPSIEKPATNISLQNGLPSVQNYQDIPLHRNSTAKSRLVPIIESKINKRQISIDTPQKKPTQMPRPKMKVAQTSAVSPSPSPVNNPVVDHIPEVPKTILEGDAVDLNSWDSAARRFDQQDPAKNITHGVHVEDIIEPTSDYHFSPFHRKNPFVPDLKIVTAIKQAELAPNDVEIPIVNPLQSFETTKLSVIGIWEGEDRIWKALIQTPANQGIETKIGDPAGDSGGRIIAISTDGVIVREFKVRTDGTREYRDTPLYMGADNPANDNGPIGGRVILRPGAATPDIEYPPNYNPQHQVPTPSMAPVSGDGQTPAPASSDGKAINADGQPAQQPAQQSAQQLAVQQTPAQASAQPSPQNPLAASNLTKAAELNASGKNLGTQKGVQTINQPAGPPGNSSATVPPQGGHL